MGGTIDSNQEPDRPRNPPLQKGRKESLPKEPAARKPQLPSIRKEKLQEELSAQSARAGAETEVSKGTHQAPAASEPVLRRPWGRLRLRQARNLGVRPRRVGGETRAEERGTMLGRAGDSARSKGPPAPLPARGGQLPRQVCSQPSLHDRDGEAVATGLPPPARRRLPPGGAAPASRRGGGAREGSRAREGAPGARGKRGARGAGGARGEASARGAGGARASGAREGSWARGGEGRAALPEDPLPLRRVFG